MTDPPMPMLGRRQFRLAFLAALNAAHVPAAITSPADWSEQPENLPCVRVRAGDSTKEATQRGAASYTSSVTVELETMVESDTGEAAQNEIETLDFAVENALLTNADLIRLTQKIDLATKTTISAEGARHVAVTVWMARCEFYEAFDIISDAPASMQPVVSDFDGITLHVDLVNLFDKNGDYPNAPFPDASTDAPRQAGPDGRDEAIVQINFSTQE